MCMIKTGEEREWRKALFGKKTGSGKRVATCVGRRSDLHTEREGGARGIASRLEEEPNRKDGRIEFGRNAALGGISFPSREKKSTGPALPRQR